MKKKTAAIIIAALVITLGGTTAFALDTAVPPISKSENRIRGIFRYPVQPKQRMFLL